MSPRSKEFMDEARECLGASRALLESSFPGRAVSDAYYAMLYAARAALSEEDRYAKTHKGVWSLFSELFVKTGRFENALFKATQDAQDKREAADYDAGMIPEEVANRVVESAQRFVDAVQAALADRPK